MGQIERQRRYRERSREGIRVVPVPVSEALAQSLIVSGHSAEADEPERGKIAEAILRAAQQAVNDA